MLRRGFLISWVEVGQGVLTRLSTFASKTPAVAGVLLIGLHYTVDFAVSAASPEIFGGGWAGNVSPSRSSRIDRSGFGSHSGRFVRRGWARV